VIGRGKEIHFEIEIIFFQITTLDGYRTVDGSLPGTTGTGENGAQKEKKKLYFGHLCHVLFRITRYVDEVVLSVFSFT
jgi:hypothetical protein